MFLVCDETRKASRHTDTKHSTAVFFFVFFLFPLLFLSPAPLAHILHYD